MFVLWINHPICFANSDRSNPIDFRFQTFQFDMENLNMFLCEKCLEKYKISCSLEACVISYGNCEECKLTRRCFDVPHEYYVKRPIIFNPSRR